MRIAFAIAIAMALAGCATGTVVSGAAVLSAAGYSLDAYCRLTPEGRRAVRDRLRIKTQYLACEP